MALISLLYAPFTMAQEPAAALAQEPSASPQTAEEQMMASELDAAGALLPPVEVWWSPAIAAGAEDALDDSLYEPFVISLTHQQSSKTVVAQDCFDTAELMERGYRPYQSTPQADHRTAYLCLARRIIAGAGIAKHSHFRDDTGAIPPLGAGDMMTLPAILGPGEGCDLRAIKQLTANDWISIARYFHIYIAGQKHDYREDASIIIDRAAYTPGKLLVEQTGHDRVTLTSVEGTYTLERLGLADVNGDGVEDMIVLRSAENNALQLVVLTKPRAESLVSLLDRRTQFLDFAFACPAQAVTLASTVDGSGICD